jgi:hypothetical protein
VTSRFLGALSVLALVAFVSPAFAATAADTRCDPSADAPGLPEAGTSSLTIEVVEHTSMSPVAPGRVTIDASMDDGGSDLEPESGPPRVEALLRRILDNTRHRAPGLPGIDEAERDDAPLATDQSESIDAPVSESTEPESDLTAPRLPGISGDDLLRFKRHMYRTDI